MKNKIIEKATDMFLNFGFKSVTMDDLASELAISKKTIYAHFQNKTRLVEATTNYLFDQISHGITGVLEEKNDPIEELFKIKKLVMKHLKDEKTSPQYQLQKYYPKIHHSIKIKQFQVFQECIIENLNRGVHCGVFRETIHVDFIARIYFIGMTSIKDKEMFPIEVFPVKQLMEEYLEYHIRSIATEKGIIILNKLIKEQ